MTGLKAVVTGASIAVAQIALKTALTAEKAAGMNASQSARVQRGYGQAAAQDRHIQRAQAFIMTVLTLYIFVEDLRGAAYGSSFASLLGQSA